MEFEELSKDERTILSKIVKSDNPTQTISNEWESCLPKEREVLRGILKELSDKDLISIFWADNCPYHINVNYLARTYEEKLSEYVSNTTKLDNKNIIIGNNNKISNSTISVDGSDSMPSKKSFYNRHPLLCDFLISLLAGLILMFSFWSKIISFFEGIH